MALSLLHDFVPGETPEKRRRIFWTSDGWFIRLRDRDATRSRGLGLNFTDVRRIGDEVVAGPFQSKDSTIRWFDDHVGEHPDIRHHANPTITPNFTF